LTDARTFMYFVDMTKKSKTVKLPRPPFRAEGAIDLKGWDIPLLYCVDADGVCWSNNAHGGPPTNERTASILLEEAQTHGDEEAVEKISKALGLEYEPKWMSLARANGWGPLPK
jgi:hypothetical protein